MTTKRLLLFQNQEKIEPSQEKNGLRKNLKEKINETWKKLWTHLKWLK